MNKQYYEKNITAEMFDKIIAELKSFPDCKLVSEKLGSDNGHFHTYKFSTSEGKFAVHYDTWAFIFQINAPEVIYLHIAELVQSVRASLGAGFLGAANKGVDRSAAQKGVADEGRNKGRFAAKPNLKTAADKAKDNKSQPKTKQEIRQEKQDKKALNKQGKGKGKKTEIPIANPSSALDRLEATLETKISSVGKNPSGESASPAQGDVGQNKGVSAPSDGAGLTGKNAKQVETGRRSKKKQISPPVEDKKGKPVEDKKGKPIEDKKAKPVEDKKGKAAGAKRAKGADAKKGKGADASVEVKAKPTEVEKAVAAAKKALKKELGNAFYFLSDSSVLQIYNARKDLERSNLSNYSGFLLPLFTALEFLIVYLQRTERMGLKALGLAFERDGDNYVLKPMYAKKLDSVIYIEVINVLYNEYFKRHKYVHASAQHGTTDIVSDKALAKTIFSDILNVLNYNCKKLLEIRYAGVEVEK